MKESINFYYNLNISEVENWNNINRFKINNQYFYFVPFKRAQNELDDIINVSRELKSRKIEVHDIITNKFGNVLTNVYNENYILLKPIGDIKEEYNLLDINRLNQNLILNSDKSKLYHNSWANLWSSKLDYFEYQIHELGKDKTLILDTFSYYLGLGENAISYVNHTIKNYSQTSLDKISLSHKRVMVPNYKLNFLNPITFIFDIEVRDIAEYLKSSFFKGNDAYQELKELLQVKSFSIYSYQLLYARLLYPTYYFDIYEKIMNGKETEDALVPIVEKASDYEIFLKDVYYELNKYVRMERIEWLLKK